MRSILIFLLLMPLQIFACSCLWTEDFCTYADSYFEWTEGKTAVVRARFIEFRTPDVNGYAPLYDFEILEVIAGALAASRVTLWGQDGGNCNGPVIQLTENEEYIVMFSSTEGYVSYYPEISGGIDNPYPIFDYPGCGPATLEVDGNRIKGEIQPGLTEILAQQLREVLQECLGDVVNASAYPGNVYEATIYPNPVSEWMTVQFAQPTPVFKVSLYDLLGRLIAEDDLGGMATTAHEINIRQLPAGVYLVVAETDGIRVKRQVVVM